MSKTRVRTLWLAVIASRLLVAAAGVIGETQWSRNVVWESLDPQKLTARLGSVGNALAGSAVRWDSLHYLTIVQSGYRVRGTSVFFPLYPLLIRLVKVVTRSAIIAGVLISAVSFIVALVLLYRLASRLLDERAAQATVLLLAFAPLSFYFTAVYTESLFLALSLCAFELATRKRWFWALAVTALATLTRVPGILLVIPIAIMWWRDGSRQDLREISAFALPPLALASFLTYLHSQGMGWFQPLHDQDTLHGHSFVGPLTTIYASAKFAWFGLRDAFEGQTILVSGNRRLMPVATTNLMLFVVLVIALVTLVLVFRRLPIEYGIYSSLLILICLVSPLSGIPLTSFDRYMLVAFPLWTVAGDLLARRRLLYPVLILSALGLCFDTIQFARWIFVA